MVKKNNNNGRANGVVALRRTRANPIPRRAVAGGASGTTVMPRRRMGSSMSTDGQRQILHGYDFVQSVQLPKNLTSLNAGIMDIGTAPSELSGTRWAQLAAMYEKYRFLSLTATYVPAVSSVVGGQIISYFELDPTDVFSLPSMDQMTRIAMAHQNAKLHNIYDNVTITLPLQTGISDFFVERGGSSLFNNRFTQQARFRMVATAGISGFYDATEEQLNIGSVYFKYTCEFKNPQIQPNLVVPLPAQRFSTGHELAYLGPNYLSTQTGIFALPSAGTATGATVAGAISIIDISGEPQALPYSINLGTGYAALTAATTYNLDTIIAIHNEAPQQTTTHAIADKVAAMRFNAPQEPNPATQGVHTRKFYLEDSTQKGAVLPVNVSMFADGSMDLAIDNTAAAINGTATFLGSYACESFGIPVIIAKPITALITGITTLITNQAQIYAKKFFSAQAVALLEASYRAQGFIVEVNGVDTLCV